jgi:hypothetical protein
MAPEGPNAMPLLSQRQSDVRLLWNHGWASDGKKQCQSNKVDLLAHEDNAARSMQEELLCSSILYISFNLISLAIFNMKGSSILIRKFYMLVKYFCHFVMFSYGAFCHSEFSPGSMN